MCVFSSKHVVKQTTLQCPTFLNRTDHCYLTSLLGSEKMIWILKILVLFYPIILGLGTSNFAILEYYPSNGDPIYKSEGDNVTMSCQVGTNKIQQ